MRPEVNGLRTASQDRLEFVAKADEGEFASFSLVAEDFVLPFGIPHLEESSIRLPRSGVSPLRGLVNQLSGVPDSPTACRE